MNRNGRTSFRRGAPWAPANFVPFKRANTVRPYDAGVCASMCGTMWASSPTGAPRRAPAKSEPLRLASLGTSP
ncbi:MAG: hypothetical protein FWE47_01700 [Oscillospiraceae bacterium]|nr:hypothetical protein [Oscillospiraceae bacterium]